MEGRLFCFLLALQIVSWTSATSMPLAPNDGFGVHQPGHSPQSLQVSLGPSSSSKEISLQSFKSKEGMAATINKEANAEVDSKLGIGSSPPSCEHKCYGCIPCEAIQVPTTTKRSHVGLQYANYEPESWKCKCGPSLYSP
ncbi:EPIDERMAL PATTERNING FACTOR-like protein 3 isoform X1 [Durio zibethinus]|uniref:Epidermal patterning factor-like protein n=1 Tax=Durio zibethinus TaxID=66656 RepID=A0A6P5WGX1_DURZI|nr:EPIDERMAL PATTERNING FACTOR-like protein 3 isoform X1 [Durio zibethinus]